MHVLRAVVGQVKKQRSEQKAALKPIQLWAELAHDMAGALEEPITSAFAQVCSLIYIYFTIPRLSREGESISKGAIMLENSANIWTKTSLAGYHLVTHPCTLEADALYTKTWNHWPL